MANCIIVPCYNEERRLPVADFEKALTNNKDIYFCFVNDGSSDNTIQVLNGLLQKFPNNIKVVDKTKNAGKASAVHSGINAGLKWREFNTIGYLDADLATSIQEYIRVSSYIEGNIYFTFGSRVRRIGSRIKRKIHRHLIGRVFATLSSTILDLPVYDTQCGAKAFTPDIAKELFKEPFISDWSFDIEIFYRLINIIGKEEVENRAKEIPLEEWKDVEESKVKFSYSLKLPFELLRIKRHYSKLGK